METFSSGALLIVALVAFNAYRRGELGSWLRGKFFNQDGSPAPAGTTPSGAAAATASAVGALAGAAAGLATGTGLVAPVVGPVTSSFGAPRGDRRHEGIDLAVASGTPVAAARAGRVLAAGASGGYGLKVDLDHGGGLTTRYGHLSKILVRIGQDVAAGSTIALSGNTGESTGPHLHFEVRQDGIARDPAGYLGALR